MSLSTHVSNSPSLPIDPRAEATIATPQPLAQPMSHAGLELSLQPQDYSLMTDLYQLTMTATYVAEGLDQRPASFELFTRRLPQDVGYLIAMGLTQALDYLQKLQFSSTQLAALQATGLFDHVPDRVWSLLADAGFTGDVWAVPEGTAVFANEPLLRIEAPLWQAQLVETYLLNTINYQTLIATRAARMRDVAGDQAVLLEFGTRRAFSPQAAVWAARAALAAGFNATSNVLAALNLGRKPAGTMAHSLVMALAALEGSESQAFQAFHRCFPGAPLLIDTYDSIAAAQQLAIAQHTENLQLSGIRLDSGDLVAQSQQIRQLLPDVPIFASGDLDEYRIAELQAAGACIDGYGLGTQLVTGVPVNGVYKLVEIAGIPVMKESEGKVTYPGRKQILRRFRDGQALGDRLGLANTEFASDEQPLLQQVMHNGNLSRAPESLETIAQRTRHSVQSLPAFVRQIQQPIPWVIDLSADLQALTHQTRRH